MVQLSEIFEKCEKLSLKCSYDVNKQTFSSRVVVDFEQLRVDVDEVTIPNIDVINKVCEEFKLTQRECNEYVLHNLEHEKLHGVVGTESLRNCLSEYAMLRSLNRVGGLIINFCEDVEIERRLERKYDPIIHYIDCTLIEELSPRDIEEATSSKNLFDKLKFAITLAVEGVRCNLERHVEEIVDTSNIDTELKELMKKLVSVGVKVRNRDVSVCECLREVVKLVVKYLKDSFKHT